MKMIMRPIRWIVGKIVLVINWASFPKPGQRSSTDLDNIKQQIETLAIYEYRACPFCVKVRRELQRLGLPIELRDAKNNSEYRDELKQGGGKTQVPCLRIPRDNMPDEWMYESNRIIAYLQRAFPLT